MLQDLAQKGRPDPAPVHELPLKRTSAQPQAICEATKKEGRSGQPEAARLFKKGRGERSKNRGIGTRVREIRDENRNIVKQ